MADKQFYELLDMLNDHPEFFSEACPKHIETAILQKGTEVWGSEPVKFDWSVFTVEDYSTLSDKGLSDTAIAAYLDVTVAKLYSWKHNKGISKKRNKYDINYVWQLHQEGFKNKEIAAMIGAHPTHISVMLGKVVSV